jgi:predicted nucleic acid-binding Zn ribbon protein
MYCKNCGTKIDEEQDICLNCGAKNLDSKKKSKRKKICIIIGIILIIIALFIGSLIFSNINTAKHNALIQQVSVTQLDLYQHKLIPTLMGDFTSYVIQDVKCGEVSPEGKAQYAIGMDSKIIIGDKSFQYPIAVLFNDNNSDNRQYVHDAGIEKEIIDYEKEYKAEQENKNRLSQTVKMTAKDLYYTYDKNEVDANNKYTGKTGVDVTLGNCTF